jgi:hypothetical protein
VPGLPAAGAAGVGIDGVPIFPHYNNRGPPTAWTRGAHHTYGTVALPDGCARVAPANDTTALTHWCAPAPAGQLTWISCEVDKCNAHSGKGEDYHYHGLSKTD